MTRQHQDAVFQAMGRAEFYPHPVEGIEERDTHISKVFLTGKTVYKIKKSVNLGFLDFSSLEKRRQCCEKEIALNRRLTRGIYLDVVPVCRLEREYHLGGPGTPVEYAVRMRQLPDDQALASLLRRKAIGVEEMKMLARKLSGFYGRQGPSDNAIAESSWNRLRDACNENFQQTEGAVGDVLNRRLFYGVKAATRSFLESRRVSFTERIIAGRIRDSHGDLRTSHIYFAGDSEIQIIDCIEFNDRLRHIDVASDLAFLAMDLDFEGAPDLGAVLIDTYVRITGDIHAYALVPFYKCYRAMVRCKVNCIGLGSVASGDRDAENLCRKAARYLILAHHYAVGFSRPSIWVICGIPATGKSTIAKALSEVLGIAVLRSDVVRKTLFRANLPDPAPASFQDGIYTMGASRLTYGKLLRMAQEEIDHGRSVILDATFSGCKERLEVRRLGLDRQLEVRFIECSAPDAVVKNRLEARKNRMSASDARRRHFDAFKRRYSPLNGMSPESLLKLDSSRPLGECVQEILNWNYLATSAPAKSGCQAGK